MATVIHEATHQAAYNVGIHHRYFPQPKWFKEGLATLFEAPGINNPAENLRPSDRISRSNLLAAASAFDQLKKTGIVETLVHSDGLFNKSTDAAYGISWAMSLYLYEKFPRNYVRYIKLMNMDPSMQDRDPHERLKVFTDSFGSPDRIEGGLRSFISGLAK